MPKDTTVVIPLQQANLLGDPVIDPNNRLLAKTVQLTPANSPKSRPKAEPLMRSLRRIYGDSVLEIIPQDVRDAVDMVFAYGQIEKDTFQVTDFDTPEDRNNALISMRAYAEMAGDVGYTVYTKDSENAAQLVWKVTARRGSNAVGE
jgi:hypothetical protein